MWNTPVLGVKVLCLGIVHDHFLKTKRTNLPSMSSTWWGPGLSVSCEHFPWSMLNHPNLWLPDESETRKTSFPSCFNRGMTEETKIKHHPQAVQHSDMTPCNNNGAAPNILRFGTSSMQVSNGIGTPCLVVITWQKNWQLLISFVVPSAWNVSFVIQMMSVL